MIVSKMVDPGEDFELDQPLLSVDEFKSIYETLSQQKVKYFLN